MIYKNVLEKFLKDQSTKLASKNQNENPMLQSLMMKLGGNTTSQEQMRTVRIRRFAEGGPSTTGPGEPETEAQKAERLRRAKLAADKKAAQDKIDAELSTVVDPSSGRSVIDKGFLFGSKPKLTEDQYYDYVKKNPTFRPDVQYDQYASVYGDLDESGNIIEGSIQTSRSTPPRRTYRTPAPVTPGDAYWIEEKTKEALNPYFYNRPMGSTNQTRNVIDYKQSSMPSQQDDHLKWKASIDRETEAMRNSMNVKQLEDMERRGYTDPRKYFRDWGNADNKFIMKYPETGKAAPTHNFYDYGYKRGGSVAYKELAKFIGKL